MTRLFEAKPWIICEIGSNWRNLNDCIQSISAAKACGADAVKFQAFTHDALYGQPRRRQDAATKDVNDLTVRMFGGDPARYDSGEAYGELPLAWLSKLKEKADACGIELMCTAFSPELVAAVDPFVTVHKVASSDCNWPQLLEAVAKTGKPVLLSTGASNEGDIRAALSTLGDDVRGRTVLMYCVSAYPARTIDLRVMAALGERFRCPVGFSDHSRDIVGHPVAAACAEAVAIEKHFTAFPELESPDRPHSLTADEFKTMVDYIRGERDPVIGPTFEEKDMLLRHKRRLIATSDVAAGATLEYGRNFGAYRSLVDDSRGLSPFAWEMVQGKRAKLALARGAAIGPGDFE